MKIRQNLSWTRQWIFEPGKQTSSTIHGPWIMVQWIHINERLYDITLFQWQILELSIKNLLLWSITYGLNYFCFQYKWNGMLEIFKTDVKWAALINSQQFEDLIGPLIIKWSSIEFKNRSTYKVSIRLFSSKMESSTNTRVD